MTDTIVYTPPPTIKRFIKHYVPHDLFYDWIIGPVGSGKTTGIFFKLVHMAAMQAPGRDGIRRSRAVVVRNTTPQLRDTTIASWFMWFKDGQAGEWQATKNNFILRFGDVECEVLFRPLDTPQDVARVLSLEVTFVLIDEFVEIPQAIIDALSVRCGRYPSEKDGGATNWGMWGSSNPSTEDNWWYNYLHEVVPTMDNAEHFKQPSGFAPDAENIGNLPGKRGYYETSAKGKSEAWIKQFLESEWGYSISGTPVVPTFKGDMHVRGGLQFNRHLELVIGIDPGITGTAAIFGQHDTRGRLLVLGELIAEGYGAKRFISELLRPYLTERFPTARPVIAPDPAAGNRSQTDERAVIDEYRRHFTVRIESNNRLPLRLDAIDHFTTRLVEGSPALLVDPKHCPTLVRALKGGWRYANDAKKDMIKGTAPEKNKYSHPGDAFGYLCRYFHRQVERDLRNKDRNFKMPARAPVNPYHVR